MNAAHNPASNVSQFEIPLPPPGGGFRFVIRLQCPPGIEVHPRVHDLLVEKFFDRFPGTHIPEVKDRVFLGCDLRSFRREEAEAEAQEIGEIVMQLCGLGRECVTEWYINDNTPSGAGRARAGQPGSGPDNVVRLQRGEH